MLFSYWWTLCHEGYILISDSFVANKSVIKMIMNLLEGFAAGARALYMVVKLVCGVAVGTPAVLVHKRSNAYRAFRGWRDNSHVQNYLIESVASEHDDISKPVLTFTRLRNLKSTLRATFSHRLLGLGFSAVRA